MKVRNGFVSNSSSTSFVIVGWKMDSSSFNEEILEILDRCNDFQIYKSEGEFFIGIGDYGFESGALSIPLPSSNELDKVSEQFYNITGRKLSLSDVKIHYGVLYC